MRRFIIDDENISVDKILDIKELDEGDKIYIVTNSKKKISVRVLENLLVKRIKIKIVTFDIRSKDFADKIIVFLMGKLAYKKGKIYIVSKDKFYDSVINFYNTAVHKKRCKFKRLTLEKEEIPAESKAEISALKVESQIVNTPKEDVINEIKILISGCKNLNDFHSALVKRYGATNGLKLYKKLKDRVAVLYSRAKPLDTPKFTDDKNEQIGQIAQNSKNLNDFHNNLIIKFGEDGKQIYKENKENFKSFFV